MGTLRVLHISDIHINAKSIEEIDVITDKLINDINRVKSDYSLEIDLICFAGDLIDRGDLAKKKENQLQLADEHFVTPLLNATGLSKKEFILVPGNHEVDKDQIEKMTERGLAGISTLEDINETVIEMKDVYNGRLQYFYDYMYNEYIVDAKIWSLGYSIVRNINGINVGIVGLDSAWRSSGNGQSERGAMIVSERQVDFHYNNVKDADLKICLMHHPLDWLSSIEMANIEHKLSGFDLVLRGHVHDIDDKQICRQRVKTIYNTSGKLYPIDSYYSGYSILDINMDLKTCCIYSREYLASPRNDFDKSLRLNEDGKVEYQLAQYDEDKIIECELRECLRRYYEESTEKYTMLKSINGHSPEKMMDFFVEPLLFERNGCERSELVERKENGQEAETFVPFDQLLDSTENLVLVGKKETGKTTLLHRFGIWHTLNSNEQIPVYIDMMKLRKGSDKILNACQVFMFNNMPDHLSITKDHIRRLLQGGNVLCMFDNIDISNEKHVKWISDFTTTFPNNRYIFSTEEKFYQTYTLKDFPDLGVEFKCVYLEYFRKRQVREMVTKWGEGKDGFDANELTSRIVRCCNNINFAMTPFNIAVFMTIWDVDKSFVPINEAKVMQTYLETILEKLSVENIQRTSYSYDIKEDFLGYLAYKMCIKDEYFFSVEEFNCLVDEYHNYKGFTKVESKFDTLFFEKNILFRNGNYVFFSNTSILEYCLASYATTEPELYEMMTSKGQRTKFAHEIAFYSGIVRDCSDLLNILSDEITETIIENMDILDEIENISIDLEFKLDKDHTIETIQKNRKSIEEVDSIARVPSSQHEISPMEISKINNVEESESFWEILSLYGSLIKNAELLSKDQKKIHLENYVLGLNFLLGIIINSFSSYLNCKTKDDLSEELKELHSGITEEEFVALKRDIIDLLKLILPIGMQMSMIDNIGTPKLEIIIKELLETCKEKKFTRFMLSFLFCDIKAGNVKTFLLDYIKEEESKDVLKLILVKLEAYYSMWHFGQSPGMDDMLLDLITEVQIKLSDERGLRTQLAKGKIKRQIKQQCDIKRAKVVS